MRVACNLPLASLESMILGYIPLFSLTYQSRWQLFGAQILRFTRRLSFEAIGSIWPAERILGLLFAMGESRFD